MTAKENGKIVKMMNGVKYVRVGGGWTPFEEFEKRRRRLSAGTLGMQVRTWSVDFDKYIILLHFTGPPVLITARVHSTPQIGSVLSRIGARLT
eukprot:4907172-Pyramimonas_sp.AAC.1